MLYPKSAIRINGNGKSYKDSGEFTASHQSHRKAHQCILSHIYVYTNPYFSPFFTRFAVNRIKRFSKKK